MTRCVEACMHTLHGCRDADILVYTPVMDKSLDLRGALCKQQLQSVLGL